jgi:hypothetical protein
MKFKSKPVKVEQPPAPTTLLTENIGDQDPRITEAVRSLSPLPRSSLVSEDSCPAGHDLDSVVTKLTTKLPSPSPISKLKDLLESGFFLKVKARGSSGNF